MEDSGGRKRQRGQAKHSSLPKMIKLPDSHNYLQVPKFFWHPVLQCASVVPQYPPAEQHCPLKGPPAQVKPPLVLPHSPVTLGTFEVRHPLEKDFWLQYGQRTCREFHAASLNSPALRAVAY